MPDGTPPARDLNDSRGKNPAGNHHAEEPPTTRPASGLLTQFRSVDGSGNNLVNTRFNPVAGSDEVRLTQPNFASGTTNGLIAGPNPRTISNVIASGPQAEAHDPTLSAWGYVFGQFVDHD